MFVVACKRSAPGSEATKGSSTPPAPPAATQPAVAQPTAHAPGDLLIDPAKPMPEAGMSTSATLQPGQPATVVIEGRSDIFSSGMAKAFTERGGRLPALLTLASGGGHVTFSDVKGASGCVGTVVPADGGDCVSPDTVIDAADGISGIVDHQHSLFMVGVFLGGAQPSGEAPPALDFSADALGEAFSELSPKIAQTFFIGDGRTPAGATQRFVIPDGATRLFLGFADATFFRGGPGAYDDNTGGLHATATQQK
jgi:hypothetical protein